MKVFINIYDLNPINNFLYPIGLGFYHTGIQIGNTEYTFAEGAGIVEHVPKEGMPEAPFRETIYLGESNKYLCDVLVTLRKVFKYNNYHILTRNCNTFCNALSMELLNKPIPSFLHRFTQCFYAYESPTTIIKNHFPGKGNKLGY